MKINPEPLIPGQPSGISIAKTAPPLLRDLFHHHDGIIVGATVVALNQRGLLEALFRERRVSMSSLLDTFACKPGYLHVALRCLALQGWLKREGIPASDSMEFEVTPSGRLASQAFGLYCKVGTFVYSGVPLETYLFEKQNNSSAEPYAELVELCKDHWGLVDGNTPEQTRVFETIRKHLDGMLIGPLMIAAKRYGLLDREKIALDGFRGSREHLLVALELLRHLGWVDRHGNEWTFTKLGRIACDFSLHYGLTLSYYPMLCKLPKLIFNSSKHVTHVQPGKEETHVDRTLNVLASGVAHRRYFEDSDKIVIEVFNREPISEQPRFVADMGCGDGAWLQRIHEVVKTRTLRGQYPDKYPLLMVGADYNVKAQEVAHQRLEQAEIPNLILFGDIGDPKRFANTLRERGLDIHDGLHIRAFIDHNRPYSKPIDVEAAQSRKVRSSGAHADQDGDPIPNNELEQNLVEHFRKWTPYIQRHGLIVIEAHNVDPQIASNYAGKTHATAFDTYHGYSNQYPLDFEAFMQLAEEAGFRTVAYQQRYYPSRLPFVAISLNHFKTADSVVTPWPKEASRRRPNEWVPDGTEDLGDGKALHRFVYQDGDISRPRRWCLISTGVLVEAVLGEIAKRVTQAIERAGPKKAIRVVDYGAGTGLAAIELIKGLRETGLLAMFEQHAIEFELILADFPSGWFAQGYELLKGYHFIRFCSLKGAGEEKIRLISDLLGEQKADILFASMVLHLVPPKVLPILIESFSEGLEDDGNFIWNTPDTAPTLPHSEVIHATNRALRETFIAILNDERPLAKILSKVPKNERAYYAELPEKMREVRQVLSPSERVQAQAQADKQVLPSPTDVETIEQALDNYFVGATSTSVSMLSKEDPVTLALLPSNQRYLNEIEDRACREILIRLLLKYEVLPRFFAGPAGNPLGINLHWTFGRYEKRGS